MNALTENIHILHDAGGRPTFALIPFDQYQALIGVKQKTGHGIPIEVVDKAMANEWSACRAWREHLQLTQKEVAERMHVTQSSYAQLEAKKNIRKSSREKVAAALGITPEQLDF